MLVFKNGIAQQNYTFEIFIKNQIDSLPVSSLSVLLKNEDGDNIKSVLTSGDGHAKFLIEDSLCGKLYVTINSELFQNYFSKEIKCVPDDKIQVVYLLPAIKVMEEVQVVQKRITTSGEKLIYNVKHDRFSPALSGSDIFRKLPGVTIVSGSVKLNGRSGLLILIDGKGELASQQEQLALLSSFSLNDILKIEVISSPSARYDANVTSVINVITKKAKTHAVLKAGLSQLFYPEKGNFGGNYISGSGSANFNFKIKQVRSALFIGMSNERTIEHSESDISIKNYLNYDWLNKSVNSSFGIRSNLNLDYDIDTTSGIGLSLSANLRPSTLVQTQEGYYFYNYTTAQLDSSGFYTRSNNDIRSNIRATAQYKKLVSHKNKSFLYINLVERGIPEMHYPFF